MARNGSGTYTFPSSEFNPAVSGATLTAASWNTLRADIETAISASIANDGQTTCSARIPFAAGASATGTAASAVAYSRTSDTNTGLYFPAADQFGLAAGGVAIITATSSSVTVAKATTFSEAATFSVSPTFSTAITSATITTVDINGGAIDGTTIGGSTAAAGTFTDCIAANFYTKSITVADDAVGTVAITGGGHVFVSNPGNTAAFRGLVYCQATASPTIQEIDIGSSVETTTGALAGTTGTDTKMTISVDNTLVYVENRTGSSKTFKVTIIGDGA